MITGADGQVGRALQARLNGALAPARHELDVTDTRSVADAVEKADVVVHLAAWTDVDGCENDPELAHTVNVGGTRSVVNAAADIGARVIYLSTDYIFDGRSDRPYRENDTPNPLNVYGRTKFEAEELVETYHRSLIVRSQWIFGDGRNFIATLLNAARAGKGLRVVDDQRGLPTPASAVADAIAFLIDNEVEGVVHVAGEGPIVSWAGFGEIALERAGIAAEVEPISTAEYGASTGRKIAPRPSFSALDTSRARSLGVPLLDWRAGLETYLGEIT